MTSLFFSLDVTGFSKVGKVHIKPPRYDLAKNHPPSHLPFCIQDTTKGTNIPKPLIPGVQKGFLDYCEKGRLAGFPITGVRMILVDGASHEVDSSEWAFYQAAQFAIEDVYHVCHSTLPFLHIFG